MRYEMIDTGTKQLAHTNTHTNDTLKAIMEKKNAMKHGEVFA